MKTVLLLLLLSLLTALPAPVLAAPLTSSTALDFQAETAAWGCTADVSHIQSTQFNGYYAPGYHVIVLIGFENIPLNWQKLILAHEVGHCLQAQEARFAELYARGPYEVEWDADAFMIKALANRWGLDGADLNQEIWGTLYQQYRWKGREDSPHGLSTHRQTRGSLNRWIVTVQTN